MSAAGPGGGGVVGGVSGGGMGAAAGGGHGGGMAGGGHGGVSSGTGFSGAHSGVSFSNNAGMRGTAFRGNGISPSSLSAPYHNVFNPGLSSYRNTANTAAALGTAQRSTLSAARPANAWSGMAVNAANNPAVARGETRSSYRANAWSGDGAPGQHLYPGAPGANLPTYNRGDYGHRGGNYGNFSRYGSRYYYYPYAYGPYYAPYINYFGGDYGGYYGAYPYYNDIPTADTQFGYGANTVSPQFIDQQPAANTDNNQSAGNVQPPQDSASQRQQPPDANGGTIPNNGPDSLVEAVQEELVRRGYFGGKVDAMYNPETKEALRKFQADHHLAATGLINEATLHALQLD